MICCALPACGGGEVSPPVTIGMSASLSGTDMAFGTTASQVVQAAVDKINAEGGCNGHPLVLEVVDDRTTDDGAVAAAQTLIADGAVAIIGPFNSGPVSAALPAAMTASVPIISPSSTAPALAGPEDGGWLFRTAPNDDFQVLAMSHYFLALDPTPVHDITIVHITGTYGDGLSSALRTYWVDDRTQVVDAIIPFDQGTLDNPTAATLWSSIAATNPTAVVGIGFGVDANALIRAWASSGQLPGLQWLFADAAKESNMFGMSSDGSLLPAEADGVRGTAPTAPITGIAFQTFVSTVSDEQGIDVSQDAYMPNTWDAAYLVAAAITKQSVDSPSAEIGGAELAAALTSVSKTGQTFHAGQWRELQAALINGSDVDYDGASGPVDFTDETDPNGSGETLSPYEVWELQPDGSGGWKFVQVEYMETSDLL